MLNQEQLQRLSQALSPKTVAIIGTTKEEDKVGYSILESLTLGGFRGKVFPIHPRHETILDIPVFSDLSQIQEPIDLAIIALNEQKTLQMLEECGRLNIKGVVSVAGGFSEVGDDGRKLQEQMTAIANAWNIMLIGPNTLGVINVEGKLNATFWPLNLDEVGKISLITQSGGVGQMVGFKMQEEGLAFNKMIGLGNRAKLDFDDLLQYLGSDPSTTVIGVFLEGTEKARSFIEVARQVVPEKPIVALKVGRSKLVQEMSITHTGSMAGSYKMYHDIFTQANIIPTGSVPELVSMCKALSLAPLPKGDGLAVVTPTAGPSLMLVDMLDSLGCRFYPFKQPTLLKMKGLFANVPVVLKNPLDAAAAGYSAETYIKLVDIVLEDPGVDLLIALSIEHKHRQFPAEELIQLGLKHQKPILVYYMGNLRAKQHQQTCQKGGIPFYCSPEEAAWGAAGLVKYSAIKKELRVNRPC